MPSMRLQKYNICALQHPSKHACLNSHTTTNIVTYCLQQPVDVASFSSKSTMLAPSLGKNLPHTPVIIIVPAPTSAHTPPRCFPTMPIPQTPPTIELVSQNTRRGWGEHCCLLCSPCFLARDADPFSHFFGLLASCLSLCSAANPLNSFHQLNNEGLLLCEIVDVRLHILLVTLLNAFFSLWGPQQSDLL